MMKGQYIHTSRDSYLQKYFTLGGCTGPERPTITSLKIYFTLGGCTGPERPIHTYKFPLLPMD